MHRNGYVVNTILMIVVFYRIQVMTGWRSNWIPNIISSDRAGGREAICNLNQGAFMDVIEVDVIMSIARCR